MEVRRIKVGELEENCYILIHNKKCIVIDPGDEFNKIKNQIGKNKLIAILITHRHSDHIGALAEMLHYYSVLVYDYTNLKAGNKEIDEFKFEVLPTPGHTKDSLTYIFNEYNFMFTGDFLFKNTIGRTDLETGNMMEMRNSLNKIIKYNDHFRIYPGHGDVTTLREEMKNNPFLNEYY